MAYVRGTMRAALLLVWLALSGSAQVQNPMARTAPRTTSDPTTPPARDVRDERDRLAFHLPSGWNFTHRDGELSTFALDARSAMEKTQLHAVANMDFNPFPYSTFSGALFYVSSTPASTEVSCSNQSAAPASHPVSTIAIDGVEFKHGYNEHGGSCIESRDEIYTALRGGSCLRFDLVINTFCGGEVSGARDMTAEELGAVRHRLEDVLKTVRFATGTSTSRRSETSDR